MTGFLIALGGLALLLWLAFRPRRSDAGHRHDGSAHDATHVGVSVNCTADADASCSGDGGGDGGGGGD